jgi:hypothetical protein
MTMREDMYKVIVERPRRGKAWDGRARRLRRDLDGPMHLGMRAGYGHLSLNENLNPLRRYLLAQIGRPWNKVFSEICAEIDRRNTVQQHIHQHIRDFIAIDVVVHEGRRVYIAPGAGLQSESGLRQELYVDPRTGLIRRNKEYRSYHRSVERRRQREQLEIAARRRRVDERTLLLLLDEVWFRVEVEVLPKERRAGGIVNGKPHKPTAAESRYDLVLRRDISRSIADDRKQCEYLYGSDDLYAVSKRQISTREIKAYRLR